MLEAQLAALAAAGAITHVAQSFEPWHLGQAVAVVAATGDAQVNTAVAGAAKARRIPVNVVDDAQLSSFIFPAIIDRSPLVVAVSSAGHAPVLARRVREQIEALLPGRLGALATFMGARRQTVQRLLGAARARSGSASQPEARDARSSRAIRLPPRRHSSVSCAPRSSRVILPPALPASARST